MQGDMQNKIPCLKRRRMKTEKARHWTRKVSEFMLSNLLGTAVDTAVLWMCSTYLFTGYAGTYLLSPLISFEFAVTVNFLCSYFFIWKDRVRRKTHRRRSFFRHFGAYNLSCTGVFLLKMGILLIVERMTRWDVVFCNLLALCVSGCINFSMNEWVIFRKKKR